MTRASLLTLFVSLCSCAGRNDNSEQLRAPNPDGCYIRVWDAPNYGGSSDYISGPSRYQDLRGMSAGRRWHNRIQSVQVGPSALATAYTDTDFRGTSFPLRRDSKYSQLPEQISGEIESLVVECTDPA